jgi:hypothetical protein
VEAKDPAQSSLRSESEGPRAGSLRSLLRDRSPLFRFDLAGADRRLTAPNSPCGAEDQAASPNGSS